MRADDIADWFQRLRKHVSLTDAVYAVALGIPASGVQFVVHRLRGQSLDVVSLPDRDGEFVGILGEFVRFVGRRYFRWKVIGDENVPSAGGALMVGSHNGGVVNTDALLTVLAVYDRYGPSRAIKALAHDFNFHDATLGRLSAMAGVIPASHESASRALRAGELVLVYPGSDLDVWRSWSNRSRVELAGRQGFLKLAIREGVPIIPVASAGTHEQFIVLSRGDKLAKVLGIRRFLRAQVFPIVFSLPWGITSGFLPYFPLPAQTTIAFGSAISWPELRPEDADDPAVLRRCYLEVEQAIQSLLDTLHKDRIAFVG